MFPIKGLKHYKRIRGQSAPRWRVMAKSVAMKNRFLYAIQRGEVTFQRQCFDCDCDNEYCDKSDGFYSLFIRQGKNTVRYNVSKKEIFRLLLYKIGKYLEKAYSKIYEQSVVSFAVRFSSRIVDIFGINTTLRHHYRHHLIVSENIFELIVGNHGFDF